MQLQRTATRRRRRHESSIVIILVASALLAGSAKAQVTNYEAPGNLKSNAPLGCVELSSVTNEKTPADIYPGVAACVKSGEYQKAALLFAVAGTFAYFDQLRVSDSTARQAAMAIEMNDFADFSMEQKQSLMKALHAALDSDSPSFKSVCTAVAKLGPPRYFPAYMVQHGMSAFLGGSGSGVQTGFDAADGWRTSLSRFLHCP